MSASGEVEIEVPAPPKPLVVGQYSFGNLKAEAQKVDTSPTYSNHHFTDKAKELATFVAYVHKNGALPSDGGRGHVVGSATKTLLMKLIAMINKVSDKTELIANKNKIYKSKTHNNYVAELDSIFKNLIM